MGTRSAHTQTASLTQHTAGLKEQFKKIQFISSHMILSPSCLKPHKLSLHDWPGKQTCPIIFRAPQVRARLPLRPHAATSSQSLRPTAQPSPLSSFRTPRPSLFPDSRPSQRLFPPLGTPFLMICPVGTYCLSPPQRPPPFN